MKGEDEEDEEERDSSAGRVLVTARHRLLCSLFPAPLSGDIRMTKKDFQTISGLYFPGTLLYSCLLGLLRPDA